MNELVEYKQQSNGLVVDHLDYRGYQVDFYEDPLGSQYYCFLNGNRVDFGSDNTQYKDDLRCIIDMRANIIWRSEENAKLEWFQNGNCRDIRLVQWHRVLKVYLVDNPDDINEISLITDAQKVLDVLNEK